jgi:DNA-directed RNA polymerase subunit RPC12/RpoP
MTNSKGVEMIGKICSVCGEEFFLTRKTGSRCNPCIYKLTKDNHKKKLVEQEVNGHNGRKHDIDSAIDLLTKLGYDVNQDVNEQFLERCKTRYGITF